MKSSILVSGATGNTGLPLVKQLSAIGTPIRAMVHSLEKKAVVEGVNVEVVNGDFEDRTSLERALEGIEHAYLVSPPSLDQVKHQVAYVDAAKKMGVKHIVKLSALGSAPDSPVSLLRWHAEVEEHIRKSGITYTFLHPHFFMENLLASADSVNKDGKIYSPLGDASISIVSVLDIAAVAVKTLTEGTHGGRTYTITGPSAVTYAEIARTVGEVRGKPVAYVQVPFEATKQGMVQAGYTLWLAEDLTMLMRTWAEGRGNMVSRYVEKLTGHKPLSIREFFEKHKSLFLAAA